MNEFRQSVSTKFGAYDQSSSSLRTQICSEFDSWLPRIGINGIVAGLFAAPIASFEHDLQHVHGQWAYNKATAVLGFSSEDYYKIIRKVVRAIKSFELNSGMFTV